MIRRKKRGGRRLPPLFLSWRSERCPGWRRRDLADSVMASALFLLLSGPHPVLQEQGAPARHYQQASELLAQGELSRAEAEVRRALAAAPRWPAALNLWGIIFRRQGRVQEAVRSFERALALNPDHVAAGSNLGYALLSLGQHRQALARFDRVLELDPNHSAAWAGRARVLLARDDPQEALQAALQSREVGSRRSGNYFCCSPRSVSGMDRRTRV